MERKSMGQFIAALRRANGLTQQNVADRLNVSNKAVSRWERDESAPDLSLIPALAELLGVTCDELLKGERILHTEKPEPRVDKQRTVLINRTISNFKNMMWIAFALCAVGLICMFGISYGFYRPVIGFAVMLLLETAAFITGVIGVNRMKGTKTDNELFENADLTQYDRALGNYSFFVFFSVLSAVVLSAPLVLVTSDYIDSVLSIKSYRGFFAIICPVLALVYFKAKAPYISRVTGKPIPESVKNAKVLRMNVIQLGLVMLGGVLIVIAPYFESYPYQTFSGFDAVALMGLLCLVGCIAVFAVFLVCNRGKNRAFLLPGLRNLLLIGSALLLTEYHHMGFGGDADGNIERYDSWDAQWLWLAVGWTLVVFVLFSIIDALLKKRGN